MYAARFRITSTCRAQDARIWMFSVGHFRARSRQTLWASLAHAPAPDDVKSTNFWAPNRGTLKLLCCAFVVVFAPLDFWGFWALKKLLFSNQFDLRIFGSVTYWLSSLQKSPISCRPKFSNNPIKFSCPAAYPADKLWVTRTRNSRPYWMPHRINILGYVVQLKNVISPFEVIRQGV